MSFVHELSPLCTKGELDLFAVLPTSTSIESSEFVKYKPISSITDGSAIEFFCSGLSEQYIDPSVSFLTVETKIVTTANADITTGRVAFVNNALHSIFSDVNVYANDKLISTTHNMYGYKAYFYNNLSHDENNKNTQLQLQHWHTDTAGKMDSTTATENAGFDSRFALAGLSQKQTMMGTLVTEICLQNRFIPNGVDVTIKLIPAKPEFALMTTETATTFKYVITDATFSFRKAKLNAAFALGHAAAVEKSPVKLPVPRVEMKTATIPSGLSSKSFPNLIIGQVPKRIIFGLVTNEAFNGSFKTNPFNFQTFNLRQIVLKLDGRDVSPSPLILDSNYYTGYHSLLTGLGCRNRGHGIGFGPDEYKAGNALFAFDLTPDLSASDCYWSVRKQGAIDLDLVFSAATTAALNIVVWAEYENLIQINKQRNVTTDY